MGAAARWPRWREHSVSLPRAFSKKNASNILITFLENKNSFNENDWSEMNKFANETFVDESDELKEKSAGAGLTDND